MTFNLMTVLVLLAAFLASSVKILREYERGVVFRLGRIIGAKGPGLIILIPGIDKMVKVDLRTVTLDVPPQDIITRDNVSVKVSAVVYFRVLDAIKAIVDVADFHFATSQLAQTTLRSVCGQGELDNLLAERDEINDRIQSILDKDTSPWGVKVSKVEVRRLTCPKVCVGQWLNRPRQSGSVVRQSLTRKGSFRPLRGLQMPQLLFQVLPRPCSFAICRH